MNISTRQSCLAAALVAATLTWTPTAFAKTLPIEATMVSDVAEKVTPAVVNITTKKKRRAHRGRQQNPFQNPFGPPRGGPAMGAGSGVVISPNGEIVTNNHVIEGADEIVVTFSNQREYRAKLIGTDKASDLAFLQIEASNLPYLTLGDSSALRLGEFVLAVGNPFGVGQTVTMGIVSAKGRANMGIVDYEDFIQTDASINPGNSGGALVNLAGELVGINTAILSRSGGNQGIGFAVPTNMVRPIRSQIAKNGKVRRGYLGVYIQDLTPDLADTLKLDRVRGVLVSDVLEDSPAARGALEPGDVITKVDGKATMTAAQLKNRVALIEPGSKVRLAVLREGAPKNVEVTLIEKDAQTTVARASSTDRLSDGLVVERLNSQLRSQLDVPRRVRGLVVSEVAPGSPAAQAGLTPGDVIVTVNRRPVKSASDIARLIPKTAREALLRVYKRGGFTFIVLRK